MSITETTPTPTCPECGGVLEATTKVYWSNVDGRWVVADADNESFSITCANDHDAEALLSTTWRTISATVSVTR